MTAHVTSKVTLEITYDPAQWHDPIDWDWAILIQDAWSGPVQADERLVQIRAMHLDEDDIETIMTTDGNPDAWLCICGNQPHYSGFYPYHDGREVEPTTDGPWDGSSYVCADCYRVIDQRTLEVLEVATSVRWLHEQRED